MPSDCLKVTAHLCSMLADDAPHLDSLLITVMSRYHMKKPHQGAKLDRQFALPETQDIPIPLLRATVDGWAVPYCSSPILSATSDGVEYIVKKIGVERAEMMAESERKVVATTNSWTKSYRLPLRVRRVDRVVWFARGDRRELLNAIRRVKAIGSKVSDGYGLISKWEVDRVDEDYTWFARSSEGAVLMRPLPRSMRLPHDMIGYREDYGSCSPPYWHQDRFTEIVVPC